MALVSNTVEGGLEHLIVRHPEGAIVVLGDGVKGHDGYLELCDPKGEQYHSQGEHSQPQAGLPHPHVYQGVGDHPSAEHSSNKYEMIKCFEL